MKFSAVLLYVPLVVAGALVKRDTLPSRFTLESSVQGTSGVLYPQVMYASGSTYIGNVKYDTAAEPLYLSSGGDGMSFTSFHSSPTGWQTLYIFPAENLPIGFTQPHSGSIPVGAATTDFSMVGGQLTWRGGMQWQACKTAAGSYQIYWEGVPGLGCVPVGLYLKPTAC